MKDSIPWDELEKELDEAPLAEIKRDDEPTGQYKTGELDKLKAEAVEEIPAVLAIEPLAPNMYVYPYEDDGEID